MTSPLPSRFAHLWKEHGLLSQGFSCEFDEALYIRGHRIVLSGSQLSLFDPLCVFKFLECLQFISVSVTETS